MLKKIISIILFVSLLLNIHILSFANEKSYFYEMKISDIKNNLKIFGNYPLIKNLKDKDFENNLNLQINEKIKKAISSVSYKNIGVIEISYDVYISKNILSIVLYIKDNLSNKRLIDSFVIDINTCSFLKINQVLGANSLNFINKIIESQAKSLGKIAPTVNNDTMFFIKNNDINIAFNYKNLNSSSIETSIFTIKGSNLKSYTIKQDNYYLKSDYNIKMLPLREILENLNFKVTWNNNEILILKNNNIVTKLIINENKYFLQNQSTKILEFAPDEILGILYTLNKDNSITISSYTTN